MSEIERLASLEQRLDDIETLLQGNMADGINGGSVIRVLARMVETVYGPKDNPGGLVHQIQQQNERMDKLFRLVYMGAGAAVAVNIGWMIFTHFQKP
jgi:hypothetical protein